MTTLLLVRHGATSWNLASRLQGMTDIPLSADGIRQAQALRPLVEAWHPQLVVSSPLSRAAQTAALLCEGPAHVDARLVEAGLGRWEGLTAAEIGGDVRRWRDGEIVPPGGEPPESTWARLASFLRDHGRAGAPSPILVVTHGGVIRVILDRLIGLRPRHLEPLAPASLTVVELTAVEAGHGGEAGPGPARLRQFNLRGEPAGAPPALWEAGRRRSRASPR